MSDESEQGKSEQPTSYKLNKARSRGIVARSADLSFVSGLAALIGYLWIKGPALRTTVELSAERALVFAPQSLASPNGMLQATGMVLSSILKPVLLLALTAFVCVLLFELVQTGWAISAEPLKPDFSRLNPGKNFKRLFSIRLLIETAKGLAKILVYGLIAYFSVEHALTATARSLADGADLAHALARGGFSMLSWFLLAAVAFAILDQLLVRREFLKKMKMSRRELRREIRDREGDHRMKSRRKQLHRDFAKHSQSMKGMRGADVLITNPTHLAVALKYQPAQDSAPTIVAQGSHQVAQRLKRLALLYGVEVVENRPLARALIRCQLHHPIPQDLFPSVSVIYRALRQKQSSRDVQNV